MSDVTLQKELAIKCLEMLNIYKPYIRKFKSKASVPCFFENYAGFYADQEEKLWNKIQEVETSGNYIVYAITHELTDYGETWSMLCVPRDTELEDILCRANSEEFYAFAYVWNETAPHFSEFGDIVVRARLGGIKRTN
jgi:hypothetical protein